MPKNEMLDNRLKSDRSGMALEMLQENSGSRIEDLVKSMGKDNTKDGDRLVTKALEVMLSSFDAYRCRCLYCQRYVIPDIALIVYRGWNCCTVKSFTIATCT